MRKGMVISPGESRRVYLIMVRTDGDECSLNVGKVATYSSHNF